MTWYSSKENFPHIGYSSSKLKIINSLRTYAVISGKFLYINMKMGMYWIEPPWISVCLIQEWVQKKAHVTVNRCEEVRFIWSSFNYLNSLLVKDTHDRIFRKNTSYIPVDNGSSLNITIRIKIIVLTNRTLIETSVSVLYLSIHSLIFNLPLLCTSSWRFEICLPPI